jgi:Trk K+ transport system NAD-binding subunit
MTNMTIEQAAKIPYKYVRVYSPKYGHHFANVGIDKIIHREKIKREPNARTIWCGYRECSLHELITYRGIAV